MLVAVADVDSNRALRGKKLIEDFYTRKTGNKDYVNVKTYGDYKELLLNKSIDAVLITTPDHWHSQPAIEAALAGKDIYLEKPTSLTITEGRLLSDVIKRKKVILQVGNTAALKCAVQICSRTCKKWKNRKATYCKNRSPR